MTSRTVVTAALVAGVALGIALDRSADQIVRPLDATQATAVPVAQTSTGPLTDEETTVIRVAHRLRE